MPLSFVNYRLLADDAGSTVEDKPMHYSKSFSNQFSKTIIFLSLILSVSLNIGLAMLFSRESKKVHGSQWGGFFSNLVYEIPTPIYSSTEYGPGVSSQDQMDQLWNALDISPGIITLSDEWASQNDLPLSMRFPWNQKQGIYNVGAFHQMHCLKEIYTWISASYQGHTPPNDYHHVAHCMDTLLQDVWCHADDTPWYQLPPEPARQKYAKFQTRQCKSWDKLLNWVAEHNACFKYENVTDSSGNPTQNQLDHYKFCPEDSPYFQKMTQYFERHKNQPPN